MMLGATAISRFFSLLQRAEEALLCLLLIGMILLACVQILLRTLFSSGLLWADPLLRYLVLWGGLLGAAMATARGKHIAMDIITFLVPKSMEPWLKIATDLFSAIVAGFLTWAAVLFIRNEYSFNNAELLSIPFWAWNLVFPLAFALMALRFFTAGLTKMLSARKSAGSPLT